MSTGNGYGFQVVIDNFGFPVKLIDAGNGNYKFQFIHHNGYLSDDGWMYSDGDDSRARTITLQDQGNGNYRLYNTNNNRWVEDWYGNVVGDGTENRHNYIWQFLSKEERDAMIAGYTKDQKLAAATSMRITLGEQTAEAFDAYISANYIGIDQSSKIQNGTFDTSHNTEGWTTTANSNRSFTLAWGNTDPKTTPEVYEGAGSVSQTITVDNVGLYKVSVNAYYRCGNADNNNRIGDLGYDGSVAYLKANDNFVKISDWYSGKIDGNGPDSPSQANSTYFSAGKYLNEVYVYVGDAKTIEISLHSHAFTWGGWFAFNNFKLTYYSDQVSDKDATDILAEAATAEAKPMLASLLTTLTNAKSTFDGSRTIANYNALNSAISNANVSINAYANAKAYLDEAETILEGTNVYTSTAYGTYYATPKAKYDARSLTNDEANALVKTSPDWHSANTIDEILLSAWTIGGEQCANFDKSLYINTWSVEGNTDGSKFFAPFYEYWVSSGSLAANNLVATVTGLKANTTYSFTIRARVQGTTEKIENGITMKVGEGAAVDISAGTKFQTTNFYIGNFSALGETDADGKFTVTITVAENSNISWLSFYDCKYTEGEDLSAYIADYNFAKTTAQTNITNNPAVTGKEKVDLQAAIDASVDNTNKADLIAKTAAINTANATFVAAEWAYNTLADLNTDVLTKLGVAVPTITDATTAADLDIEGIIVSEYNAAKTYATDMSAELTDNWSNKPGTYNNEKWDGTNGTFYDRNNVAAFDMAQTITLPAGDYALIVKGRGGDAARITLSDGSETIAFAHKGNTGRGVTKAGAAAFDGADDLFANNGNGFGWETRVLTFTSDGTNATTLTLHWACNGTWCGIGQEMELRANLTVAGSKSLLSAEINTANGIYNNGANVGDGAFQIPTAAATDMATAISDAQAVYDNASATVDQVLAATESVKAAVETYKNVNINAPADGKLFNVILTYNGYQHDNKAITFIAGGGNASAGNYTIQYKEAANKNLAQAFTFTKVSGNNYKMSQIDADGVARYVSTGVPYGGNTAQIRTTTDASQALVVTVIPTATEGVYNLRNTEANQYIGSQDAGMYTVNSHIDFKIVETTKPSISINTTDAGWGTTILPFAVAELPTGVKAYTCAATSGNTLTLVEVNALEANKPYIIEGAWKETLTGDAQGTELTYEYKEVPLTGVYLTGVYADYTTVGGEYVMQKQGDVVGFYQVGTEDGDAKPVVRANRAYLTAPAPAQGGSGVKAFFFGGGEDAIKSVFDGVAAGEVYDLSGRKISKLQRGVNIVNGKKVMVK